MSLAGPVPGLPYYWERSAEVLKAFSVPGFDNREKPLEVWGALEFMAFSLKKVLLDSCARIGSSLPSSVSVMSEARSQMSAFDEKA